MFQRLQIQTLPVLTFTDMSIRASPLAHAGLVLPPRWLPPAALGTHKASQRLSVFRAPREQRSRSCACTSPHPCTALCGTCSKPPFGLSLVDEIYPQAVWFVKEAFPSDHLTSAENKQWGARTDQSYSFCQPGITLISWLHSVHHLYTSGNLYTICTPLSPSTRVPSPNCSTP